VCRHQSSYNRYVTDPRLPHGRKFHRSREVRGGPHESNRISPPPSIAIADAIIAVQGNYLDQQNLCRSVSTARSFLAAFLNSLSIVVPVLLVRQICVSKNSWLIWKNTDLSELCEMTITLEEQSRPSSSEQKKCSWLQPTRHSEQ
jgi:hypothetical protein